MFLVIHFQQYEGAQISDLKSQNDKSNLKDVNFERLLHKTIKKVMEKANFQFSISNFQLFLKLLAPFAPHITEEIWREVLGNKTSLYLEPWPEWDEKLIEDETFQLVVQVNGKVRATLTAERGISQAQAERLAREDARVAKYLEKPFDGLMVKKVIFVKDRLINFVL